MLIPAIVALILFWIGIDIWRAARARQRRDRFRHIVGPYQWWGKR